MDIIGFRLLIESSLAVATLLKMFVDIWLTGKKMGASSIIDGTGAE
ncbi:MULTISPECIES: hypothetical protein [Bacillaceae]